MASSFCGGIVIVKESEERKLKNDTKNRKTYMYM
jgi:hypothetical protein